MNVDIESGLELVDSSKKEAGAIIAIAGRLGVGKTTSAKYLSACLNINRHTVAHLLSFADTLKEICRHAGWDGEKDERGRRLLQHMGDVVREYNEHYFADTAAEKAVDLAGARNSYHNVVIIDDMRFENEYQTLKKAADDHSIPLLTILLTDSRGLRGEHASENLEWAAPLVDLGYSLHNRTEEAISENLEYIRSQVFRYMQENGLKV